MVKFPDHTNSSVFSIFCLAKPLLDKFCNKVVLSRLGLLSIMLDQAAMLSYFS